MLTMEIKQRSYTWLTSWIRVFAGNISNENQAKELHMTHKLDESSCKQCQQQQSSKEAAHDSQAGWEFMQTISAMEIKAEELHMTHNLDKSSCRQCQQWKSSWGAAHDSQPGWKFMQAMSEMEIKLRSCTWLTTWMRVHAGKVSNGNQAKELHMTHCLDESSCRQGQQWKSSRGAAHDSLSWWEFMQAMSAMEIKQRSCTWLTVLIRVHSGNVSNGNQAEELPMTHFLDKSSCRQCQQWKSSWGAAHDSHSGWEFIQAISAIEIKLRSCPWLTPWMRVHADNVSSGNQAEELHMTHILDKSSCKQCQQWKSN